MDSLRNLIKSCIQQTIKNRNKSNNNRSMMNIPKKSVKNADNGKNRNESKYRKYM